MLSETQRATTEFLKLSASLREAAAEFRGQALSLYTGALIESICLFGEADKYGRQGDRRDRLGVQRGRAEVARDLSRTPQREGTSARRAGQKPARAAGE